MTGDERPVYRRVGVEMLLGEMIELRAFPVQGWTPDMIEGAARDLYEDRKIARSCGPRLSGSACCNRAPRPMSLCRCSKFC